MEEYMGEKVSRVYYRIFNIRDTLGKFHRVSVTEKDVRYKDYETGDIKKLFERYKELDKMFEGASYKYCKETADDNEEYRQLLEWKESNRKIFEKVAREKLEEKFDLKYENACYTELMF